MSLKQDGTAPRTAADLERKYNFGRTFAEVYGLITDAQKLAEEAKSEIEGLDHEEIFNLLTNYGEWQGIYRGDDDNVYINATYIKSGKVLAEFIDADNLQVKAANITGELKVGDALYVSTEGIVKSEIEKTVGDLGTDEEGIEYTVASKIEQTAESITSTVEKEYKEYTDGKIGDLGQDGEGVAYTVASKIEQTAESITSTVSKTIGDLGEDEEGNDYTVASKIEQTAESIKEEVYGYLGTDEDGNPISVSSSITTALTGIEMTATIKDKKTTLKLTGTGGVEITSTFNSLTEDDLSEGSTTRIYGGLIETDSVTASALHLSGLLTVYDGGILEKAGGYIGYSEGFAGNAEGVGIVSANEYSEIVCTDNAVRLSYTDDGYHYTQLVCGQNLALSSPGSIQFSIGGDISNVVAGLDYESFYPADPTLTLGTALYKWADVYAAGTSMSDLLKRVKALEGA